MFSRARHEVASTRSPCPVVSAIMDMGIEVASHRVVWLGCGGVGSKWASATLVHVGGVLDAGVQLKHVEGHEVITLMQVGG